MQRLGFTVSCPHCGKEQDSFTASGLAKERQPTPGDYCVCATCAEVCIYEQAGEILSLRKYTEEDEKELLSKTPELWAQIMDLSDMMKRRTAKRIHIFTTGDTSFDSALRAAFADDLTVEFFNTLGDEISNNPQSETGSGAQQAESGGQQS